MNTNRKTNKQSKMKITTSKLIQWSGLAAMAAGILYIVVQVIHPTDMLSAVTTSQWAITHYLSFAMDLLALVGITGLYAGQVDESGWLGLSGYLLFSLFWAFTAAFHFIETFISPVLATVSPQFVESLLGIVSGHTGEVNLGALPTVYLLTGLLYMLGGLLFGIATFRAGILSRWAAGLLSVGIVLPVLGSSLVQHPFDRIFAVPVGLGLAWLGYALFSENREKTSESLLDQRTVSPESSQVA